MGSSAFSNDFTPEERAHVAARTAEIGKEELTLRDLRQAQHLTQERLAELPGVEQENVRAGAACRSSAVDTRQLCRRPGAVGWWRSPNRHLVTIALADTTDEPGK